MTLTELLTRKTRTVTDARDTGAHFVTIYTHRDKQLGEKHRDALQLAMVYVPLRYPGARVEYLSVHPHQVHLLVRCADGTAVDDIVQTVKKLVSSEASADGLWQLGYYDLSVGPQDPPDKARSAAETLSFPYREAAVR